MKRFLDSYFELITGSKIKEYGKDDCGITIALSEHNISPETELPVLSEYRSMAHRSKDLRLIIVFQKDTHIPIYIRYVPDRLLKTSNIFAVNQQMVSLGIGANFTIMDSGYCTLEHVSRMCMNDIQFTMMIPEDNENYERAMDLMKTALRDCNTSYERDGLEFCVSSKEHTLENGCKCYLYAVSIPETVRKGGEPKVKLIVSSNDIGSDEAVSICYVRNFTDKFLTKTDTYIEDTMKVRGVTPTAIRGHIMVSFIAASLVQMIRNDMELYGIDAMDAYDMMKNQKCKVFESRITPTMASDELQDLYDRFGFECPAVIPRR